MEYNIQVVIERAKDNNYTCKVIKDNKNIYLYSKYYPKKNLIKREINNTNYIILGLGLGYEVQEILEKLEKINKKVYVIDFDKSFYDTIKNIEELNYIINSEKVIFLFGDEYKQFIFENDCSIYFLDKIISLNERFFCEALNFFKLKENFMIKRLFKENDKYDIEKKDTEKEKRFLRKKKIIFFEGEGLTFIIKECASVFEKMGFETQFLYVQHFENFDGNKINILLEILIKEKPDIIFSANYLNYASLICGILDIYYISWVVDHPWAKLYKEKIENEKEFVFDFEEKVVEDLRKRGLKNIYYLPCAVNVAKFNKSVCKDNFSTDISFIGNLHPIIEKYNKNNIEINKIIETQNKYMDRYIIRELLEKNFPYIFDKNIDIKNKFKNLLLEDNYFPAYDKYISLKDRLALIIAFQQSHISRLNLVKAFEQRFDDFKVYGSAEWAKYINCWQGHSVEYFNEMPEIFNKSKININILNSQYETAIPLRLFDILGSAGFVLTNYREKLLEYFEDGVDIAVFRNIEEALELADYYLKHDELRIKMVENAYEKIKKFHTYEDRIKEMIKIVFS